MIRGVFHLLVNPLVGRHKARRREGLANQTGNAIEKRLHVSCVESVSRSNSTCVPT